VLKAMYCTLGAPTT